MKKTIMRLMCLCLTASLCLPAVCAEGVDSARILAAEQALYALGYHDDDFNAQLDAATQSALRAFQTANGLEPTGELDARTLEALGSGTAVTCYDYLTSLASEYANLPILQMGSSGESVRDMQQRLRDLGYFSGACDGVYGEATQSAVQRFQMAHGLSETGMADCSTQLRLTMGEPLSWDAFCESASAAQGDAGASVRRLQRALAGMGYFEGSCTGEYGDLTRQAVEIFQLANDLEPTGTADAATCSLIYSGAAAALREPGTLCAGDSEEAVSDVQSRLAALGYFERSITGFYGATTETAVRLFQLANGLPATGEADPATLERLNAGDAVPLEGAREAFSAQVLGQDGTAQPVLSGIALNARGQSFAADDEDLYRGFAFVQYACVAAGIPISSPEEVVALADAPVGDPSALRPGDVIVLRADDGRVTMAISSGSGRAVYATQESGWVLESDLSALGAGELYRWDVGAVQ